MSMRNVLHCGWPSTLAQPLTQSIQNSCRAPGKYCTVEGLHTWHIVNTVLHTSLQHQSKRVLVQASTINILLRIYSSPHEFGGGRVTMAEHSQAYSRNEVLLRSTDAPALCKKVARFIQQENESGCKSRSTRAILQRCSSWNSSKETPHGNMSHQTFRTSPSSVTRISIERTKISSSGRVLPRDFLSQGRERGKFKEL